MFSLLVLYITLSSIVYINANSEFENEILVAHNECRAKHGVAEVTLDDTISAWAQEWADELARRNEMEHRPNNKYGENLYGTFGTPNGTDVVMALYSEIEKYDFDNPDYQPEAGHFTQIVWKNCDRIGVGQAKGEKWTYVVINYETHGNVIGQFEDNVFRPIN